MNKRRKFSAEFKAKVVLEALTERLSMSELGQKHEVHPNMITTWKKEFLAKAPAVFGSASSGGQGDTEKEKERLYEKIGKLQVEVDFLKKVSTILNR
jgi:transposase-like protein